MLNIWELLKGLKYRINGGEWEVQTGTGEVIRGTAANAAESLTAAGRAAEQFARREQARRQGQQGSTDD